MAIPKEVSPHLEYAASVDRSVTLSLRDAERLSDVASTGQCVPAEFVHHGPDRFMFVLFAP
ncbi:hypothetical protein [Geodermatophilus sp. DSM 45219]|uniref:hypothetical protein n=1 Tax=Geodermatophilus sp. DSM 45219 TaxID=1881103 RepID=UPI000B81E847|nr:hypothetical protein [Geodermatophilus sp. DSM 45219]